MKRLHQFTFDRVLQEDFWEAIEKYVSKDRVVGSTGVLEVRLWSKEPCITCWTQPKLLAGFTLPFEIADVDSGMKKKKAKKKAKKKQKDEL